MQSLRDQLAETQGALTEKLVEFRNLRAEHQEAVRTWARERADFEARLQRFDAENQRLRSAAAATSPPPQLAAAGPRNTTAQQTQQDVEMTSNGGGGAGAAAGAGGGGVESRDDAGGTITISHRRMRLIEDKYQEMTDQVAEKTRLCEALQRQMREGGRMPALPLPPPPPQPLSSTSTSTSLPSASSPLASSSPLVPAGATTPSSSARLLLPPTIPMLDPGDEHVAARYMLLRDRIRSLSLDWLVQDATVASSMSEREEYSAMTPNWRKYLAAPSLGSYFARALVWRYLQRVFEVLGRPWGRDASAAAAPLAALLLTTSGASGASGPGHGHGTGDDAAAQQKQKQKKNEHQHLLADWRAHTAALIARARPAVDGAVVDDLTQRVLEATLPFAGQQLLQRRERRRQSQRRSLGINHSATTTTTTTEKTDGVENKENVRMSPPPVRDGEGRAAALALEEHHPEGRSLKKPVSSTSSEQPKPDPADPDGPDPETEELRAAVRDVVAGAADLAATLQRSRYALLMAEAPGGGARLHGFGFRDEMMEARAPRPLLQQQGGGGGEGDGSSGIERERERERERQSVVDLMITPCLLARREGDYSVVVKSEVVC
ncbi:hypothetical protein GGR56DRAFT_677500 [Xylariaceae sp. FL0804]|nr:hypothetical protein GGR56DRAFT_677500 [Xylariaceae sp. FL0804]